MGPPQGAHDGGARLPRPALQAPGGGGRPAAGGLRPRILPGRLDLQTIAVARLVLDNIAHIKAYRIMLGAKAAQVAMHFEADDLDGTVVD
jgi:hypothetical protein